VRRPELFTVEKVMDDLGIGVKGQSRLEIAGLLEIALGLAWKVNYEG